MKPLIREGERSRRVTDIQARLRALGIEIGDEPGVFGASTTQAVRAFQQNRGILVDGIVGPHTWRELIEAGWRLGDRILYMKYPPMRGDDVAELQRRLNALGFDAGREDGIFGADTDGAVRAFQKEYAVPEDGIFGPKTLEALAGLRVDRPGIAAGLREELRIAAGTGLENMLIVVDPGHGGDDRGERSPHGRDEADVCWDLAVRVADRLAVAGARVRFTRIETEGPDVSTRARRANEMNADLFVSLHLNANPEATAEGASTFFFGGSRAGEALAEAVQRELSSLELRDCRTHARSYPLLKETRMPAVIIEPVFVTNPDEAKRLEDVDFRNQIADAIVAALQRYCAPGS